MNPERVDGSTRTVARSAPPERGSPAGQAGLLAVQRIAGNAAVLAMLGDTGPAPVRRSDLRQGATIRRFVNPTAFKWAVRDEPTTAKTPFVVQQVMELLTEYDRLGTQVEVADNTYPFRIEVPDENALEAIVLIGRMKDIVEHYLADEDTPPIERGTGFSLFSTMCDLEIDNLWDQFERPAPDVPIQQSVPGHRKVELQHEGGLASSMELIGAVVSRLAPHTGDHGEAKLELSIPVPPVSIDLVFLFEAKKLDGEEDGESPTEVNCEITVGPSIDGKVAKIGAALGGYTKAQAPTPEEAMLLISYGLYRRCKESPAIPKGLSSYLWNGATDDKAEAQADLWSRRVEEEVFSDEHTYVETGAKGALELGLGHPDVFGIKAGMAAFSGKRYDKKSLENSAKGAPGELNTKTSKAGVRNQYAQQPTGRSTEMREATGAVTIGPFTGSFKYGYARRAEGAEEETRSDGTYWEVRASCTTALPGLAKLIDSMGPAALDFMKQQEAESRQKRETTTATKVAQGASHAYSVADVVVTGLKQMNIAEAVTKFDGRIPEGQAASAISTSMGLELYIQVNHEGPKATDVVIDIRYIKEAGVGVPGLIKAQQTKRSRLCGVILPKGKDWKSPGSWQVV